MSYQSTLYILTTLFMPPSRSTFDTTSITGVDGVPLSVFDNP